MDLINCFPSWNINCIQTNLCNESFIIICFFTISINFLIALALFEHVNLVYGTISEFCTPSGCPDMTGPGNR